MEKKLRTADGMDSAELNQHSYNGSSAFFERRSFQFQNENNETSVTVSKLNTVHIAVVTYQPIIYDWIIGPEKSKTTCSDDQEHLFDRNS